MKQKTKQSQTVWKYVLKAEETQDIEMPKDYSVMSVGVQDDDIVIWVLVDPLYKDTEICRVKTYGTGWPMNADSDRYRFVGTSQIKSGLVFHIFVRRRDRDT